MISIYGLMYSANGLPPRCCPYDQGMSHKTSMTSLVCLVAAIFIISDNPTEAYRRRRQSEALSPSDSQPYQPPLLLGAPAAPKAILHNSYQPPIALASRNTEFIAARNDPDPSVYEYRVPQGNYLAGSAQSVQYVPPEQPYPAMHQSSGSNAPVLSSSSSERTYNTQARSVESSPAQSNHRAPISENDPNAAKQKAKANDEYIVYYYYYYDNDTSATGNQTLNFDDIPSLESYDERRENDKTFVPSANALLPTDEARTARNGSQGRSVSSADNPNRTDRLQTYQPVSNVFRYSNNEVPRFPVSPNFVIPEVQEIATTVSPPTAPTSEATTTPVRIRNTVEDDDSLNNVLDNAPDAKAASAAEEVSSVTTTPEAVTTTEIPTTTTEKSRRRPTLGRRRTGATSSFSSSRNRSPTRSSTTSTTIPPSTTSSGASTRRSFQSSNRVRSRPSIGSSRTGSRGDNTDERSPVGRASESSTASTTTAKSRFTSAAPKRFQSNRSRSQTSSSTSSTTRSSTSLRPRSTTSRPRVNIVPRNRPSRPGFLRPRPGSEPEEQETTTVAAAEETSQTASDVEAASSTPDDSSAEEDEEEQEEVTTTEANRLSGLFKMRNRNALGGRPRPQIGNRPPRS